MQSFGFLLSLASLPWSACSMRSFGASGQEDLRFTGQAKFPRCNSPEPPRFANEHRYLWFRPRWFSVDGWWIGGDV